MSSFFDQVSEFLNANGVECSDYKIARKDYKKALSLLSSVDVATAMPGMVHPTDFNFDKVSKNLAKFTELMQKKNKKLIKSINQDFDLYMSDRHIFVVDNREDSPLRLALYIRFDFLMVVGVRCVSQVELWRLPVSDLEGVTKFVFFTLLSPLADAIASDNYQTDLGKRFWMTRCSEALKSGCNVYLADQNLKTFTKMEDYVTIAEEADHIWGDTHKHIGRRLLITKKEL